MDLEAAALKFKTDVAAVALPARKGDTSGGEGVECGECGHWLLADVPVLVRIRTGVKHQKRFSEVPHKQMGDA